MANFVGVFIGFIRGWQIAIENRIHRNPYMDFGNYLVNIGQEFTLRDEILHSGNISEF